MSANDGAKRNPILVAIDTAELAVARDLCRQLTGWVGGLKFGKEFFTALGPEAVRQVAGEQPFFLDLKFHDIPNTVAGALRSAVGLGPSNLNISIQAFDGADVERAVRTKIVPELTRLRRTRRI